MTVLSNVNRIGYGAMQLENTEPDDAVAVLRRARELGVDHVDTAEFYTGVNELIRRALHPYDGLVLASKVGAVRVGKTLVAAQKPVELRAQVEANLASLGTDQLPVVNLRRVDGGAGIRATGDQVVPLADQLAELVRLRDEGAIGAIGLSNVSLDQLREALPVGIAEVQNHYSLIERGDEALLDVAAEHGIAWVPFFPLGSGRPGVPKVTELPVVREVAAELDVTPAQVGLAWLLARDPHVLLIPGTSSLAHLAENMAVADITLDAATKARLSDSAATVE